MTKEEIINAVKELAQELGVSNLGRADFARRSGIPVHQVYALFPEGGWTALLEAAGLQPRPQDRPVSDDELIAEFHRVATALGRTPTWAAFNSRASISADTVRRRFGGMDGTLSRYRQWLSANHPDSPLLTAPPCSDGPTPPAPAHPLAGTPPRSRPSTNGPVYGAPINFRGLQHAPINEQGVVYLFGIVSLELGFIVEAVQAGFPDCEAKRRIDPRHDRWQRVRIEFEHRSSNFREHGHDPTQCDLIVCWEHDWQACPLEVIELRSVIQDFPGDRLTTR